MPTYDGIGSSITHEIEVVGDVFISNVEGGSLSTQVPFEIFSNVYGMATPPTDSRQVRLRVQPTTQASPDDSYVSDMGIQNTTDNYFFITAPQNTSSVGDQNTFVISKTSNVGIGTTDPTSTLHVVGDELITGTLTASNIVGGSPLTLSSDSLVKVEGSGGLSVTGPVNVTGSISTTDTIRADYLVVSTNVKAGFNTNGTSVFGKARIGYNGVDGGNACFAQINMMNGTDFALMQNTSGGVTLNRPTGSSIFFTQNDVEQMRIHNDGNVGIGTNSPGKLLDVNGHIRGTSITSTGGIEVGGELTAATTGSFTGLVRVQTISATDVAKINNSILTGGATTSASLATKGNAGNAFVIERTGVAWTTTMGMTNASGHLQVVNNSNGVQLNKDATSWSAISDERFKKNITILENNLDVISNIRCVSFNYKHEDDSMQKRIGFIAQDWLKVLPEIVDSNDADEEDNTEEKYLLRSVDAIPVLCGAIKELKTQLDMALARIESLEKSS